MKKVIIGIDTKGVRTTKVVEADNKVIVANPSKFGFSKVSAVMTEQMYKQVMESN